MAETPPLAPQTKGMADSAGTANAGAANVRTVIMAIVTGVILLALAVALLRFRQLSVLPPDLHPDEGAHGLDALQVLQGKHAVFFPRHNGREGMVVYAVAFAISVLGRTVLALRLPTTLASAGTVFAVFWLGSLLFGRDGDGRSTPWRGLLIGGAAAGLLAVSLSQTILGRTAYRGNYLPLLLALVFALLWLGWRQKRWWIFALAGLFTGLLPYTYLAARATPLLFVAFGLSFFPCMAKGKLDRARTGGGPSPSRSFVSVSLLLDETLGRRLSLIGIFLGVAGLVAAPILAYFVLHPGDFFYRSDQVWFFGAGRGAGEQLNGLLRNTWEHLLAFGFHGDANWRYNFPVRPMLNPVEALFFWFGAGIAAWNWKRRPAYRLLFLWTAVLLLPAVLADYSPHFLRMIGVAPAVYLLVGIGIWEAVRLLHASSSRLPQLRRQIPQDPEVVVPVFAGTVAICLILFQGIVTYRTVYQEWAKSPGIRIVPENMLGEAGEVLRAQPLERDTVYLVPGFSWSDESFVNEHNFRYLFQAYIVTMEAPDLAQRIESVLNAVKKVSTVKVLEWNSPNPLIEDDTIPIDFLLRKYGRYAGTDQYADFRVHSYTNIIRDRPWTLYDYLEPLSVHYDGFISLHGFALGQGERQLSADNMAGLDPISAIWGVLRWQRAPDLEDDYAVSLRLYDGEGESVLQEDMVLWNPANFTTTSDWPVHGAVDSLFHLELPAGLPPGDYQLRLVVYDAETLIPTVEIGVWEPESFLAQLRLR